MIEEQPTPLINGDKERKKWEEEKNRLNNKIAYL